MLRINRTYIKVFLSFWLVTILTLVGSNLIVHFLGLGPEKHITHRETDPLDGPGGRLLREMVSDAVNYDMSRVKSGLKAMPAWASNFFYVIDDQGHDLLDREIPPQVQGFLDKINHQTPFFRINHEDSSWYARLFTLSDGSSLKLVVLSPHDNGLRWKLYFNNFWHILLLSIIISGAACYYVARYMTRDIQTLKTATQQIAHGNWDIRIANDLSERCGEVHDLGNAFDHMAAKVQQTMMEQKRLVKDVSHELRSPLARLQVALAIAQQRANSEIKDELEQIKRAADYLNDVISNILSLPLTDQESWELNDVVEISSLLSVILEVHEAEARDKNVTFAVHNQFKEALVQTRSNTLAGVFSNVLRNAIRYTADNTPISIYLSRVENGFCEIKICDQGPGVDSDQLEAIFEPFFRTDEARCRKKGGYGLGLAIAKRTINLHGGSIKAQLNNMGGLTVIIRLPEYDETFCLIPDITDSASQDI